VVGVSDLLIAEGLALPLAVVTEKLAVLAQSGAGKSYLAMRLAELMLSAGAQVVALDPVGPWWGLRATADGEPSGLPIVVFGGEHGDLPLDPTAGSAIADVLVDLAISAVLDLSDLEMPDQKRFTAAFAERFFFRKKRAKSPVHLFLEEAQVFAPQFPERDETTMLNRVERLCRIGRNYGIGWTIVSQRPQEVHKKVLNQAGTLFALRTVGRHERKAIADWVVDKATAADARRIDALPSLETGTAQVWSPAFLRVSTTIQVSRRETFDSSRTPEVGEDVRAATIAPIDVEAIRERLGTSQSESTPTDTPTPRDTNRALAEARRLIEEHESTIRALRARPAERVEVLVPDPSAIEKLAAIADGLTAHGMRMIDAAGEIKAELARARLVEATPPIPAHAVVVSQPTPEPRSGKRRTTRQEATVTSTPVLATLNKPQRAILGAIAKYEAFGHESAPRPALASLSGLKVTSSHFANTLSSLRTAELIDYPSPGMVALTIVGRTRIRSLERQGPMITTLQELHAAWLANMNGPQQRIFRSLLDAYPRALDRETLAVLADLRVTSSHFANTLSSLRSLGAIDYPAPGQVVATETLFPEGLQ
jgi:uncharacterized protein